MGRHVDAELVGNRRGGIGPGGASPPPAPEGTRGGGGASSGLLPARPLFRSEIPCCAGISAELGDHEPEGPDACVLTTGADDPERMALYLAMAGYEFEVLEPPEVRAVDRSPTGFAAPSSPPGKVSR